MSDKQMGTGIQCQRALGCKGEAGAAELGT